MRAEIIIETEKDRATKTISLGQEAGETIEIPGLEFFKEISELSYLNSGIMPVDGNGLICVRKTLGFHQLTYQVDAGCHFVMWGYCEGDDVDTLSLAMPFRIIVLDFMEGGRVFLGARHFYSPEPIYSLDQQLYHTNLPNTNCRGYRDTSVGWICLYGHGTPHDAQTINDLVHFGVVRTTGDEAFNDANMGQTDGPGTYFDWVLRNDRDTDELAFLWDKQAWSAKTKTEGPGWALDKSLWMPIKVQDIDHQDKHVRDGENYTLYMALYGNYTVLYGDSYRPKIFNQIDRDDVKGPSDLDMIDKVISNIGKKKTRKAIF